MKVLSRIEEIAYALEPNRNGTYFHCAAIFKRNKILSIGVNSFKTHPLAIKYGYDNGNVHAELAAVVKMGLTNCSGLSIAVLRIGRNNKLAMSKPCCHCNKLIYNLGFKSVYFTDRNGKWENLI
jgi:deoxycytidylate deaminase